MKVKVHHYSRVVAESDSGNFDLDFEPCNDPVVQIDGDTARVGYLVYDSYCENPMTSCDCMGEFITEDSRDQNPWTHLGLTEKPYRGEIVRDLECDGVHEEALRILTPMLIQDQDFLDFCEENYERTTEEDKCDMAFAEACLSQIDFKYDTEVPLWLDEKYEAAYEAAWDILFEEGKIGTHLAVPCRWHDSVHGPGTAQAYQCSVENCNAVWIPTKNDLDNIKAQCWPIGVEITWRGACGSTTDPLHAVVTLNGEVVFDTPKWRDAQAYVDANFPTPTHADLQRAAENYAKGCLDEFVKYCNGECYGVAVETFKRNGEEWEKVDTDACWGYIGYEYAEESLDELMKEEMKCD